MDGIKEETHTLLFGIDIHKIRKKSLIIQITLVPKVLYPSYLTSSDFGYFYVRHPQPKWLKNQQCKKMIDYPSLF